MGTDYRKRSDQSARSLVLKRKVQDTISRFDMIRPGQRIVTGVSGGADSMCLLEILRELCGQYSVPLQIRAVHVHHGLRESADRDEEFVRNFCRERGIPLEIIHCDVQKLAAERRMSLEEAGRTARFREFRRVCRNWDEENAGGDTDAAVIAVAHHVEDRAETVLLNLCRGSSLAGLAGIHAVSFNDGVRIIHPLIQCTRQEIEDFLRGKGIGWCEDETNRGTDAARNYVRLRILPELTLHVNQASTAHIVRTAEELEETEQYLQAAASRMKREISAGEEGGCSISELKELPAFLQRRVLYQMLSEAAGHRKDLTAEHIEAVLKLTGKGGSGKVRLPYGVTAVKEYDRLRFVSDGEEKEPMISGSGGAILCPMHRDQYLLKVIPYGGDASAIPGGAYTKWIDYDKISEPVCIRAEEPGDRMILDAQGHSKKLSRIMMDRRIPQTLRDKLVFPMSGDHVLWFPGYRIGADVRIDEGTRQVLEISLQRQTAERGDGHGGKDFCFDSGRSGGEQDPRTGSGNQQGL